MAKEEIKIFGPASVSNVGPGFDLLGFALESPGDELILRKNDTGHIRVVNETDYALPSEPDRNVAAVAAMALLEALDVSQGFDLVFTRKIQPGSGVGSSAASCVAAVVGINELLGSPFETAALIPFALEGEKLASGSLHADNIAPALLGGITLIRGYDPLDIKHLPYPDDLWCSVVHPALEIKTAESRKLIPQTIPLKTALQQCGNLAGLVAGLATADYGLIGRSVEDLFAEPYRVHQVPDFAGLRKASLEAGSVGTGLSGSGPSVFSLCRGQEMAEAVGGIMRKHFSERHIRSRIYISRISPDGCRIIS
jgi:homoserine kinase